MTDYTTFLAVYCPLSRGTNSIFVTMRTQFPELPPGITTRMGCWQASSGFDPLAMERITVRFSHHEDIPVLIGGNIGSAAYQKHR